MIFIDKTNRIQFWKIILLLRFTNHAMPYMKIKNNTFKIPIFFNLITVFILCIDFLIPSNRIVIEEFSSFNTSVKQVPTIRFGATKSIRHILRCESGNLYYVTYMPSAENQLEVGQEIFITKTIFLSKIKSIKVSEKQVLELSFMSYPLIIFLNVIAVIITLLNFWFEHKYLDVLLSFATGYVLMATGFYLYYF